MGKYGKWYVQAARKDTTGRLLAKVRSNVPWHVTSVEALPDFRLRVGFIDGLEGFVDMSGMVRSKRAGVFAALADPARFAQVFVDLGVVTWPGELDLAPDAMYDEIKKSGEWKLK